MTTASRTTSSASYRGWGLSEICAGRQARPRPRSKSKIRAARGRPIGTASRRSRGGLPGQITGLREDRLAELPENPDFVGGRL